jgi:hypothetical protein
LHVTQGKGDRGEAAAGPDRQPEGVMNIFKGLLFLQGYLNDPREAGHDYGQTYGNAQAFSKQFAEPWELDVGQVGRHQAPAAQGAPVGCG